MAKIFKTIDGMQCMDVTSKAYKIFDANIFNLYIVWEKGTTTYKLPVTEKSDIDVAIQYKKFICIEIGPACNCGIDKWSDADKIIHEGYVYVKYSDIKI